MVLMCISFIISDIEHLFIGLLAIFMSSLIKCLLRSYAYFLIILFSLIDLYGIFICSILDINPLSDT